MSLNAMGVNGRATPPWVGFTTFAGAATAAALVGRHVTPKGGGLWYRRLRKPPYRPPSWLFGPVWSVLYTAMALSGHRVWRRRSTTARSVALGLWGTQLALNAAWSPLFFGAHRPRAALADIGALLAAIAAYTAAAARVDHKAAWMMGPYLAWTSYAAVLNLGIVRRNRR